MVESSKSFFLSTFSFKTRFRVIGNRKRGIFLTLSHSHSAFSISFSSFFLFLNLAYLLATLSLDSEGPLHPKHFSVFLCEWIPSLTLNSLSQFYTAFLVYFLFLYALPLFLSFPFSLSHLFVSLSKLEPSRYSKPFKEIFCRRASQVNKKPPFPLFLSFLKAFLRPRF